MASGEDPAEGEVAPTQPVVPVGHVSALLGVPAITLRSWELRYGIGPSERSPGQHRRYTEADIDQLRTMQRLIGRGTPPREAARLSTSGYATEPSTRGTDVIDHSVHLITAAESLAVGEIGDHLDSCLEGRGVRWTWNEVLVPAFRQLEARFASDGDCTDIELVLAGAAESAVERYLAGGRFDPKGDRPVLLVHCPAERHSLPLVALRAVLLERSQPVVLLGPDTTRAAILEFVQRVSPLVVVLWSSIRRASQASLLSAVSATGRPALPAGPGWPKRLHPLSSLDDAAGRLTAHS
ncbi:MerR family transcriptional regulator [Kribbella sp. NPDC051770]|uniref:MerR family transcriptional regulator n=1 Tax=Kribbella sp. NPDC051770 TaxID=3155413 RepID=UPI003441A55F